MANILTTTQPVGSNTQVTRLDSGSLDIAVSDSSGIPSGPVAPFVGEYYVNQNFAGVQTGSASNPFTTVAAAFAFAALAAVLNGVVYLNAAHTENVVFPLTGDWELKSLNGSSQIPVVLTGNVDVSVGAVQQRRAITGLTITGSVTGNSAPATPSRLRLLGTQIAGALTLTGVGGWRFTGVGVGPDAGFVAVGGCAISGLASITGVVGASWMQFIGGLTLSGAANTHDFEGVAFVGPITTTVSGNVLRFLQKCEWNAGKVFNSTGTTTVQFDAATLPGLIASGSTFTGTFVFKTLDANSSNRQVLAGNQGLNGLTSTGIPTGQMTITVTLTLLVPGTAGTVIPSVTYTDLLGVVQTKPVGTGLLITSPAGTEVSASLTFCTNGANGVSTSFAGVVTPGALSYSAAVNLEAGY